MAIVFLSHSSGDNDAAATIRDGLTREGYESIFLDISCIPPGGRWRDELSRNLRTADAVVFLGSTQSATSIWCAAELAVAKTLEKVILPVRLDDSARHTLLDEEQWITSTVSLDEALQRLSAELDRRFDQVAHRRAWDPSRSPFPGLRPFASEDGGVFFGRDAAVEELVRMTDPITLFDHTALVAVVGASGTGKSSLVRAGLIPALCADRREPWLVVPPFVPGRDAFRELARSFREAGGPTDAADALRDRHLSLPDALARLAPRGTDSPERALIVLDQAEELTARPERAEFLQLLLDGAAEGRRCRVVLTVREGWVDRLFRDVAAEARIRSLPLVAPSRSALATAIEGPARRADIALEPGFVQHALDDAGSGEALPLLALALERAYAARPRGARVLTSDLYDAGGGVSRAVAEQAREALAGLGSDGEERAVAVLVEMARVGEDGTWSRRQRDVSALDDREREVVRAFEAARLVVVEDDEQGHLMATVAHTAVFSAWPPVARALQAQADDLRYRSRLDQAATDWDRAGRPAADLPTGPRFRPMAAWLDRHASTDLEPTTATYVAASRRAERRRAWRRNLVVGGIAALVLLAGVLVNAQLQQRARTDEAATLAEGRGLVGRARSERRLDVALSLGLQAMTKSGADEALDTLVGIEAREPAFRGYLGGPMGATGRSLAWTPTSGLVVATSDGRIRHWNGDGKASAADGFRIPSEQLVRSVAVAPGEGWAAAGDDHGGLFVARSGTVTELTRAGGPAHGVRVGQLVAVDDDHLLSTGGDGTVVLWDVATGQAQWTVEVGVPVWSAGLLPSGQAVVVGTHDGTLLALAAADGTERGRARVGTSVVRSVAVADGRVVAGDDTGTVWVVTTSPERGVDDDAHAIYQGAGSVWTVAAADGGTVLTGWTDGVVRRVDGAGLVDTYAAHAGPIRSIAYDQRSGWFAATGDDGLVSRWSMTGGSLLVDQRTTSTADLVGAADRSGRIYVGGTDQRLSVLAAGGTALEPLGQPLGAPIDDIAVSPDGTVVAVGLLGGEVRAISTATGGVLATVSTGGPAAFVALSGDHLVAVGERAWVVDLSTDDRREIPVPADLTVAALAAADDGAEVVLGGGAGDRGAGLVRWSEQDGPTSAYFGSAGLVINAIDLDPAGRRVVIGRNDGRTEIWQIDPLAATGIGFNQHTREIYDVGFAAGGTRVVSLDGGGQVWTWSATYGTSLALALPAELDLARTLLPDDAGVDVTIVGRGGVTEARLDADHVRQLACELAPSVCS